MKLFERFSQHVKEHPDFPFLSEGKQEYTLRETDAAIQKVYGYLKEKGIGREDVVLLSLSSCLSAYVCLVGVLRVGACFAVVDAHAPQEVYDFFLQDTAPRLVVDDTVFAEMMAHAPLAGWCEPDEHDAMCILYTSSSTAWMKGTVHEYGDIFANFSHCDEDAAYAGWDPLTERLSLPPFLYDVGAVITVLEQVYTCFYLRFLSLDVYGNEDALLKEIEDYGLVSMTVMPHLYHADRLLSSPLYYLQVGYDVVGDLPWQTEKPIYNVYGQTEVLHVIADMQIDRPYDIYPVGKPIPHFPVYLYSPAQEKVAEGEIGEICLENPYFRGYRNLPKETAEAFQGGIYHTGDVGRFNEDGNLVVLGRKMEALYIDGEYLVPIYAEIAIKKANPSVWVHTAFDKKNGAPCLAVFYCGALKEEEAIPLCAKSAKGKLPVYFCQIKEVPYLRSGKLNRAALHTYFATL